MPFKIVNFLELAGNFELAPEKAVDHFTGKGLALSFDWRDTFAEEHDAAFTIAKMADYDLLRSVKQGMDKAIESGQSFGQFKKEIIPILQRSGWWGKGDVVDPLTGAITEARLGSAHRLETIFRTNLQSSYSVGKWQQIQSNAVEAPYLMYDAVDDHRVRPEHAQWDNKVYRVTHSFWDELMPPNGYNCFLPGTQISGSIIGGIKRPYKGKVVEITTANGIVITVTPKHPILTASGWVCANKITKFDKVLCDSSVIKTGLSVIVNDENSPSSSENIFESVRAQAFAITNMSTLNLDSDAGLVESKIDITLSNGELMRELFTRGFEERDEGQFVFTNNGLGVSLESDCSALSNTIAGNLVFPEDSINVASRHAESASDFSRRHSSTFVETQDSAFGLFVLGVCGSPSRPALPLNTSRRLFDGFPFDSFGIGLGANDDAVFDKLAANGVATDSGLFGKLINAFPGKVAFDYVVNVVERDFSGHVYDFESEEGLLIANGLIVHNCRCGTIQLDEDELEEFGLKVSEPPIVKREVWTNPRTGVKSTIPSDADPGFGRNPGKSRLMQLTEIMAEKKTQLFEQLAFVFIKELVEEEQE